MTSLKNAGLLGLFSLLAILIASGCAGEDTTEAADNDTALCADATEHIAACFEQDVEALPASCDAGQARQILDTDCDTLNTNLGKADAWWCNPWTPPWVAGCGGDLGDDATDELETPFSGAVLWTYESFLGQGSNSVACALVVVSDANGTEVARTHSGVNGAFEINTPLPAGLYTFTVYDRDGESDDNIPFIAFSDGDEKATRTVEFGGEEKVHVAFSLSQLRSGADPDFNEGTNTEDALRRCADLSHTLDLVNSCGEELAPYFDVRRDWVLTLTNDDTGAQSLRTPLCQPADGDHWSWDGCGKGEPGSDVVLNTFGAVLPGNYTITATRVDLPDRNNLDLADELDWRTNEVLEERVKFSFDQAPPGGQLNLEAITGGPMVIEDPWADCD